MVHQINVLTAKHDNFNLNLRTQMAERDNSYLHAVLLLPHKCPGTYSIPPPHTAHIDMHTKHIKV